MYAIQAENLVKRFGETTALAGVDLAVRPGTVLGVLGPNGAGKTTAVRMLATLLRPDAGTARVGGLDVVQDAGRVRRLIGLTGQYAAVDEDLTGTENLVLIGRLLDLRSADAKRRAADLLAEFDLTEAADRPAKTYSGGMRRRLDLAASLVGPPSVIFLDEPTTGLDPTKRDEVWATVRRLVAEGATVLLTTQYLDEADALADEISVFDHGRVIAARHPARAQADRRRPDACRSARPTRRGCADGPAILRRSPGSRRSHRAAACCRCRSTRRRRADRGGRAGSPPSGIAVTELALQLPSLDEVFFGADRRPGDERRGGGGMTATTLDQTTDPRSAARVGAGQAHGRSRCCGTASRWPAGRSSRSAARPSSSRRDAAADHLHRAVRLRLRRRDRRLDRTTTCSTCCRRSWCRRCCSRRWPSGSNLNTDIKKGVFDRFRVTADRPVGAADRRGRRPTSSASASRSTVLMASGYVLGFRIGTDPLSALAGCLLAARLRALHELGRGLPRHAGCGSPAPCRASGSW